MAANGDASMSRATGIRDERGGNGGELLTRDSLRRNFQIAKCCFSRRFHRDGELFPELLETAITNGTRTCIVDLDRERHAALFERHHARWDFLDQSNHVKTEARFCHR